MTPRRQQLSFLEGYVPSVPTPFGDDGAVDYHSLEKFCDHLVSQGARALLVCGVAGEAPTLRPDEHETIIRAVVNAVRGRAAVIAGAGSNATASAIDLGKRAERSGADLILSVVPYYNRPSQAGLQIHFHNIAKAIDLPLLIHDAPQLTGCRLAHDTVLRLSENANIVGLVDSSGELARFLELRLIGRKDFILLSGDDTTAAAFLSLGGDGCVSAMANIAWPLCSKIVEAVCSNDFARINPLAMRVQEIASWLYRDQNPARLKYALTLAGFMTPNVRAPLIEPDNAGKGEIIEGMRNLAGLSKQIHGFAPTRGFSYALSNQMRTRQ